METPIHAHHAWLKRTLLAVLFIFLVLLTAFGFYVRDVFHEINSQIEVIRPGDYLKGTQFPAENQGSFWIGSASPTITIVEFADFACPYCQKMYPKIRELSVKHRDKIRIVYRDLPLHDESALLALSARCAGEQGLFWLMHDKLYQNTGIKTLENLSSLAYSIGVEKTRFDACMDGQKYLKEIEYDIQDAQNFNIAGTPAIFINGYKLEGDIPDNILNGIIEGLLLEASLPKK